MTAVAEKINKGFSNSAHTRGDLIFCLVLLIWPTLQFAIFYLGVNFNSILLIFQKIEYNDGINTAYWGFEYFANNFKDAFELMGSSLFGGQLSMSLLYWIIGLAVGSTLGLMFSYYIYKKLHGSSFFRVILFLPSILSVTIMAAIYGKFCDGNIGPLVGFKYGLISGNVKHPEIQTLMVIIFNLWVGFGTSVLMYSNSMSNISEEVVEAAELDGATGFKEFWHISLPGVFSTWSVFFVTSIAGIFTNQHNIWTFFGPQAEPQVQCIGYYLFQQSSQISESGQIYYPKLATLGIILTLIAVPLTMVIRKLLERYGPSAK